MVPYGSRLWFHGVSSASSGSIWFQVVVSGGGSMLFQVVSGSSRWWFQVVSGGSSRWWFQVFETDIDVLVDVLVHRHQSLFVYV